MDLKGECEHGISVTHFCRECDVREPVEPATIGDLSDEVSKLRASLAAVTAEANRADERETKVRNALTAAGVPDWEPYPPEEVDAWEASLRTGGRMIHGDERVQRLAAERDALAKQVEISMTHLRHEEKMGSGFSRIAAIKALAAIAAVKP